MHFSKFPRMNRDLKNRCVLFFFFARTTKPEALKSAAATSLFPISGASQRTPASNPHSAHLRRPPALFFRRPPAISGALPGFRRVCSSQATNGQTRRSVPLQVSDEAAATSSDHILLRAAFLLLPRRRLPPVASSPPGLRDSGDHNGPLQPSLSSFSCLETPMARSA